MADKPFFAVLEAEDKPMELKQFKTLQGLADHLKTLPPGTRGHLFNGERLFVTRGPRRYLLHGDVKLPLFDETEAQEPDETDGLGHTELEAPVDPVYAKLLKETLPEDPLEEEPDDDEFNDMEDLEEA